MLNSVNLYRRYLDRMRDLLAEDASHPKVPWDGREFFAEASIVMFSQWRAGKEEFSLLEYDLRGCNQTFPV